MWEPAKLSGRGLPPIEVEIEKQSLTSGKLKCPSAIGLKDGGDYAIEFEGSIREITVGGMPGASAPITWHDPLAGVPEELTTVYPFTIKTK